MTGHVQHWTDFCGRLTLQGLQTGSTAAAENVRSAQETCKCLCKWWPLWAQTVTDGIEYELLRRLFHIGNFCFWVPFFKQLLLQNCAVDWVEICNVCARKVIIKAAKRIFNSDKICRSYCDFYFGVTFLEHCIISFELHVFLFTCYQITQPVNNFNRNKVKPCCLWPQVTDVIDNKSFLCLVQLQKLNCEGTTVCIIHFVPGFFFCWNSVFSAFSVVH